MMQYILLKANQHHLLQKNKLIGNKFKIEV